MLQAPGDPTDQPEPAPIPFRSEGRFVVLRHEMPPTAERPTHWDFMLETPQGLRTWALAVQPAGGEWIAAEALADHRAEYLTFEGPLSGGRGTVCAVRRRHVSAWQQQSRRRKSSCNWQATGCADGQFWRASRGSDQRWRFFFTADPA